MNNQANSSNKTVLGSPTMNIGVGMLIGLVLAVIVAFFAMNGGAFRDKSNKNAITVPQGNPDPNASLYGTSVAPTTIPSNAAPGNDQGAGVGVLTGSPKVSTSADKLATTDSNTVDSKTNPVEPNAPVAKTAGTDPIGELISNKAKPVANPDSSAVKVVTPKPAEPKVVTPKAVTPTTAKP